ncbi:MAG: hypothetical protein PHW95_05000 [Patescibacteria group bacterium]|nr:hypothetical protein [Patescibacteria group bacterium]
MFKEEKRQVAHIFLLIFALLLKFLQQWQVVLLLLLLLVLTMIIVPKLKIKRHFYRRGETDYKNGGVFYVLVLIVLALIFPLPVVAASWAILALGDGMATLFGRYYRATALAWNKDKTYAGSIAFIIFGSLGAAILLKWMVPNMSWLAVSSVGFKASVVAAIVESLPWKINDNISVAISAAVALAFII